MLQDATPDTRRAVLDSLAATPREVVSTAVLSPLDHDPVEQLSRYPGPVLAISAENTLAQLGPLALHLRVPGVRLKVLSKVNHGSMMDAPEAFNAALDGFLGGLTL